VRASLLAWLERRGGTVEDHAFPSRVDRTRHMSTRQYARLVDEWVTAIGLRPEEDGTHSLRRTMASMIYRATGNIRATQILPGHSKIENTVRYLGVDVEDAPLLAERTETEEFGCQRYGRPPPHSAIDFGGHGFCCGVWILPRRVYALFTPTFSIAHRALMPPRHR
jgi:hypothetical protein